jgi:hypothetical protein
VALLAASREPGSHPDTTPRVTSDIWPGAAYERSRHSLHAIATCHRELCE